MEIQGLTALPYLSLKLITNKQYERFVNFHANASLGNGIRHQQHRTHSCTTLQHKDLLYSCTKCQKENNSFELSPLPPLIKNLIQSHFIISALCLFLSLHLQSFALSKASSQPNREFPLSPVPRKAFCAF